MSYILDALKKLEHEKSRKNRGDGVGSISGVLFEHERPAPARMMSWKFAFSVIVAVLVTFSVTWQFLQTNKVRMAILPGPAPTTFQSNPAKTETTPVSSALSVVPMQHSSTIVETAARSGTSPLAEIPTPQIPVKAVTSTTDPASLITLQELRKRQTTRKGQVLSSVPIVAAPADIKLSGIAYQDDRRARRAVVNGFLLQEGGVVSGAVITDIFQDRVRFSLAGNSFELSLVSSGVPASGK